MSAQTNALFAVALLGCFCASCGVDERKPAGGKTMSIQISSSAFSEGQTIPEVYTCQGKDISPPLLWTNVPAEAKSLALIVDDPDAPAGTWVHWVVSLLSR